MLGQHVQRRGIELDHPHLMVLGVPHDQRLARRSPSRLVGWRTGRSEVEVRH